MVSPIDNLMFCVNPHVMLVHSTVAPVFVEGCPRQSNGMCVHTQPCKLSIHIRSCIYLYWYTEYVIYIIWGIHHFCTCRIMLGIIYGIL